MIEVPKSIQNKGYKHYIDYMIENSFDFCEEFSFEELILVIKEQVKEIYNFDSEVVDYYLKSKEF